MPWLRTWVLVCIVTLAVVGLTAELSLRWLSLRSSVFHQITWTERSRFDDLQSLPALLASLRTPPEPYGCHAGALLNAHGFRTAEYKRDKAAGTFRILTLGDSFAFSSGGVPLPDMWHERVARAVAARLQQPVENINLGVKGVGIQFQRRLYELEGRQLQPDLVLLSVFLGNDLTDEFGPVHQASGSASEATSPSYLARFAAFAWDHAGELHDLPREPEALRKCTNYVYDPDDPSLSEERWLGITRSRARIFAVRHRPVVRQRVADLVSHVQALHRQADADDAALVVVLIPDELQVNSALQAAVFSDDAETYDTRWVQNHLRDALQESGLQTVDLLPAFLQAAEPLYRARNTHWNSAGNRLAAELIDVYLKEEWLVPR